MSNESRQSRIAAAMKQIERCSRDPKTYGTDPELWPHLSMPVTKRDKDKQVSRIKKILQKDGPVSVETQIVIRSPKRSVVQMQDGELFFAILWDAPKGTRKRVDHQLGQREKKRIGPPIRELRRAFKGVTDKDFDEKWQRARTLYPIALEIEARASPKDFCRTLDDEPALASFIARMAAKAPGAPKASVILRGPGPQKPRRRSPRTPK